MTEQVPTGGQEGGAEPPPAQAPAPERPPWLPEKFASPEQLAQAYAELEKKLGQQSAQKPAQAPQPAQAPPPSPEQEAQVAQAGLSLDALEAEFFDRGSLSEETYKAAEAKGLSRAFLDGVVAGRVALVHQQAAELMEVVGGKEEWERVASWARANLGPRELRTFNEAVERGSMELAKLAIRGIHARYVAATGRQPNLVGGAATPGADGYRSQREAIEAMRDPRYAKDPAYRAEVEARIRVSNPFAARVIAG